MSDATSPACPVCRATDLRTGMRAERVPTHAVKLLETSKAAKAEPTGTIALTFCEHCGFVFNSAFDPALLSYDTDYESTQTHSPTYRAYMNEMVVDLLGRAPKTGAVVDVGCGQGEFLAAFGTHSSRPLIGFDPALDASRTKVSEASLKPTPFRARDVTGNVALITCKMTLEHVQDPVGLLCEMANLARTAPDAILFLQVPNCDHIFRQVLFSDILYEHVNYFTDASFRAACEQAGLEVSDSWVSYGRQHLNFIARPAASGAQASPHRPNAHQFTQFNEALAAKIDQFGTNIRNMIAAGRRPILWGAGSKAVAFLNFTSLEDDVPLTVDINPLKQGTFLPCSGIEIVAPDDDRLRDLTDVFVMNPIYAEEIGQLLNDRGIAAALHLVD